MDVGDWKSAKELPDKAAAVDKVNVEDRNQYCYVDPGKGLLAGRSIPPCLQSIASLMLLDQQLVYGSYRRLVSLYAGICITQSFGSTAYYCLYSRLVTLALVICFHCRTAAPQDSTGRARWLMRVGRPLVCFHLLRADHCCFCCFGPGSLPLLNEAEPQIGLLSGSAMLTSLQNCSDPSEDQAQPRRRFRKFA